MEARLPGLRIPEGPVALPAGRPVWLEIGFGGGEHLAGQARLRPDVLMLGAEPFLNGVASLVARLETAGAQNVRIWPGDARALLGAIPDGSVERIFLLFPDPWPKTRHRKRRLLQDDVVQAFARILEPGGRVRFATDVADYAAWALLRFAASPDFRWTGERADDWRRPPQDHVDTRYQAKGLGDCPPVFLEWVRNGPQPGR